MGRPQAVTWTVFWFLRQVTVGTYVVDIVCYDALWVMEVDGGQHLGRQSQVAQQTAWLEAREFRVPRFWNNEVLADVEAVKTLIAEACVKGTSP